MDVDDIRRDLAHKRFEPARNGQVEAGREEVEVISRNTLRLGLPERIRSRLSDERDFPIAVGVKVAAEAKYGRVASTRTAVREDFENTYASAHQLSSIV
jgi:hypothetical protein